MANANLKDFNIFLIDKSMFSLRVCRYTMRKLMIEALKMVKKCKIYQHKGPREAWSPGI